LVWFYTKLVTGNLQSAEGDKGLLGACSLVTKFAKCVVFLIIIYPTYTYIFRRETDDVRMVSSLTFGMLIQYMTTCIVCLILAFQQSWSLTLVILSAVHLLMLIQAFSQAFASPLLVVEHAQTATAATLVDRTVTTIATVKAFNAIPDELAIVNTVLDRIRSAARKLNTVLILGTLSSLVWIVFPLADGFLGDIDEATSTLDPHQTKNHSRGREEFTLRSRLSKSAME
jgi:ATP-binding cassette subfamily B (MDR/TAP) protein 1